jgi:hypothetical protein
MTKTSQQVRNMIEDWIKSIPIKYQDSTNIVKAKNPLLEWQFLIGEALHISKVTNRDDRILIHYAMNFSNEIKEKFVVTEKLSSDLANSINGFLISLGLSFNWLIDKDKIFGLDVRTYIDFEELNRPLFFKTWDKVVNVSNHVGATIHRKLDPKSTSLAKSSNTSDMNMYR